MRAPAADIQIRGRRISLKARDQCAAHGPGEGMARGNRAIATRRAHYRLLQAVASRGCLPHAPVAGGRIDRYGTSMAR